MATARWFRSGEILIPLVILCLLVLTDVLLPPDLRVTSTFVIAPIVASALTTVSRTAIVGLAAMIMAAVSAAWDHNLGTAQWWIRMTVILIGVALAVTLAWARERRERELRQMTAIAEATQRVLLRDIPTSIGSLGFAARYVSATKAAQVGGDLYDVSETPNGVRVVIGDARGKGLDAVQMAATVLAAFRHAALVEPNLAAVAADLDEVVTAVAGDEDFVTAVLAEFDHDRFTVVNCGHHPPLLLTNAHSQGLVDTGTPQPPLGLRPCPRPVTCSLSEGSRLLFYTDGLVECRNSEGSFFSLEDSTETLGQEDLEAALDGLLGQVVAHVGRQVNDDMALLLVQRQDRGGGRID